jgi:hypothetical protein
VSLTANALSRFLIEDGDVPARGRDFAGGNEARESGANDDRVSHSVCVAGFDLRRHPRKTLKQRGSGVFGFITI